MSSEHKQAHTLTLGGVLWGEFEGRKGGAVKYSNFTNQAPGKMFPDARAGTGEVEPIEVEREWDPQRDEALHRSTFAGALRGQIGFHNRNDDLSLNPQPYQVQDVLLTESTPPDQSTEGKSARYVVKLQPSGAPR